VYPAYGYGLFDTFEDPIGWRKKFNVPDAGMQFKFLALDAAGHNFGMIKSRRAQITEPFRLDKNGNPIPHHVRRYPFADEYTYRI